MATLNTKIANFINKGQTKIRDMAKLLISNFDRQGYQSADSEDLLLKLYETRNFIELLNTSDRGGMTDKEINDLIDFFWKWLELNKISFVNYPNLATNIQENITVPSGTYALQADLVAEVQNRTSADAALDERIVVLEGFDPGAIFPPNFFDNQNASNVNVWDDDTRLHTHANKTTLDSITEGLLTALQALEAHYASIGEPNGVHVSTDDRTGWNAKVTVAQLNALSTVYAPLAHTQAGADKHSISQITGLNNVISQLNTDISNMAGTDGREVELQSLDGDEIQWRYVGDETWISLGNFKGDTGEAGDPFTVDFRGPSSGRLSSAFDGEDEGFAYLETDTGYLYFRNPAGGPATSSAGWEDPIHFVGDNGWSPVLAVFEVSSEKAVFEIVDWVGGSGIKPVFDPGLSPPDPVRWFIGPAGVTLETSVAVNIRGPQGFGFGPIIGGAGTLAARSAFDDNSAGFIYLQTDVSPQVIYIKNTDTSADWGGPYAWQGTVGASGPPGSGLGFLINQAAHGLSVFTGVAFRAGAFEQYDSGSDDVHLGLITAVGSSSLATFVQAGYVSGLSGLTPSALYYLQTDGTVTVTPSSIPIFLAISATEGFVLNAGQVYTDEQAQDAVGAILDDGTVGDIDFTYDDGTPKIYGVIKDGIETILFGGGYGIDVVTTGGSDVLNIGVTNADVINIGHAGTVVNIFGGDINFEGTQHYIEDKLITLNKNGSAASGVGSGFEIEENAIITGYLKTNATRDGYDIKAPAISSTATFSLASLTGNKIFTLPDTTGTIALFSQITATNAGAWSLATGGQLTGSNTITQAISTSGSPTMLTIRGAAHTTLAASTEATDINFSLDRIVNFANGAITTQRAFRIQAPIYSHVSGSNTITTATTLSISGAPTTTGGFTTITNAWAFNVESGSSLFHNYIQIGSDSQSSRIFASNDGSAELVSGRGLVINNALASLAGYNLTIDDRTSGHGHTSGIGGMLNLRGGMTVTSGTGTFIGLSITPTYGFTDTYSGIAIGMHYDPDVVSDSGLTHYAILATSGAVLIGTGASSFRIQNDGNVGLFNASTFDTGVGVFAMKNATTAPAAGDADQTMIYSKDVSASSELFVMDEAGVETQLS